MVVFQRQGSSKVSMFYFEGPEFGEIASAAYALPLVEVVLRDKAGGEIDGQRRVGVFNLPKISGDVNRISASPFWSATSANIFYGLNGISDFPDTWKPRDGELEIKSIILFPYLVSTPILQYPHSPRSSLFRFLSIS